VGGEAAVGGAEARAAHVVSPPEVYLARNYRDDGVVGGLGGGGLGRVGGGGDAGGDV
jgi:hypothetical protein